VGSGRWLGLWRVLHNTAELHIVDRFVLGPPVQGLRWAADIVRKMHVGHVNAYAAYVLFALLFVLIVGSVFLK
jgi:hypothetical protein